MAEANKWTQEAVSLEERTAVEQEHAFKATLANDKSIAATTTLKVLSHPPEGGL